jgi:hypothetical protein
MEYENEPSGQPPSPTRSNTPSAHAIANNVPSLAEITQLTRQELVIASKTDSIRECGRAALSLLPSDPGTCQQLAYQKLHDVPYREVKKCWRRLYTDATLLKVLELVKAQDGIGDREQESSTGWIDEVVTMLDMALILTGAPDRKELIELWFAALKAMLHCAAEGKKEFDGLERPSKRRKLSSDQNTGVLPCSFPATLPTSAPTLRYPISRTKETSLSAFQAKVSKIDTHTPIIIKGALQYWPALDERPWNSPTYLLEQTLGGRRLVPIEIGKSYTDEAWGQKIMTFKSFMETHMFAPTTTLDHPTHQTGYLAQHDLFAQIPALRADISIPDYCYADPAPSPHFTHIKSVPKLEEPLLNAWFGPAGTISPLHTDPYHNILAQVVGYKYVRLYAPEESAKLYPRDVDENGIDMSNTSQVDLDEAIRVWERVECYDFPRRNQDQGQDAAEEDEEREGEEYTSAFPLFPTAPYLEAILAPGDALYLPVGWWHYIRSVTPSFSVSFWFN